MENNTATEVDYIALGNGRYRVMGNGFRAEIHCFHDSDDNFHCIVDECNNHMINAWDISLWCEKNVQ